MSFDFKKALCERFFRYVKIETTSDESSKTCPSTKGQLELGRLLAAEMRKLGLGRVKTDKFGYVTAELPANMPGKIPVVGFLAHLDTSSEACGKNVRPVLHKNYSGKRISIGNGLALDPAESPELRDVAGHDIITASGDTLLGADNKAGIAIILTALEWLLKNPSVKHGRLKIAFTPDEEIGRGTDRFDVKSFGADCAYTVDGDVVGTVEDENFNADGVEIAIEGKSYHPGLAKNLMLNAVRIAADIISGWPENMLPETTEGREGFIAFMSCESAVENAVIKGIVRHHDMRELRRMERLLEAQAASARAKYPGAKITVRFKEQYRNMKQILDRNPQVVKKLYAAMNSEGVAPIYKPIRGGTDGARLSFMGLPTPNIFTGGSNFHGKYEWVSLDGMEKSAKVVIALAREWGRK